MANKPNNPSLWSKAKSLAKQKFDVYPSAYANGWAAKWYKSKGGTWSKAQYGMEVMGDGGTPDNPGFRALPPAVQQKILSNMAYGGYPFMQQGGEPDGAMALGQIDAAMDKLSKLRQFIQPDSDLEPWVSSKLTLMDDYASSVSDYMNYNPEAQEEMMEPMEEGEEMEEMRMGGIPQRYKNMGFNKVGVKKDSNRPGKKWMVLAKKGDQYKVVHGGYTGMKDYTQHGSEKRRENFWNRMGGRNSSKATDPFSPLYWHKRFGTWENGGEIDMPEMKGGGSTWSGNAWYKMGGQPCYECGGMYAEGGEQEMTPEPGPRGRSAAGRFLGQFGVKPIRQWTGANDGLLENIAEIVLPGALKAGLLADDVVGAFMDKKHPTSTLGKIATVAGAIAPLCNTNAMYRFLYPDRCGIAPPPSWIKGVNKGLDWAGTARDVDAAAEEAAPYVAPRNKRMRKGIFEMGGYLPVYQKAGETGNDDPMFTEYYGEYHPGYGISGYEPGDEPVAAAPAAVVKQRPSYEIGSAQDPSIVNYLASRRKDFSKQARAKMAKEFGIENYTGTAAQNQKLLGMLRAAENAGNNEVNTKVANKQYPFIMIPPADSVSTPTPGRPRQQSSQGPVVQSSSGVAPYLVGAAALGTLGYMGYRAGVPGMVGDALQPLAQGISPYAYGKNLVTRFPMEPSINPGYVNTSGAPSPKYTPVQKAAMTRANNKAIKNFVQAVESGNPEALRSVMSPAEYAAYTGTTLDAYGNPIVQAANSSQAARPASKISSYLDDAYQAARAGYQAAKTTPLFKFFRRFEDGGYVPMMQPGGDTDSTFENVIEFIDPTGISSYDDVYRTFNDPNAAWWEKTLSVAGALPVVGKFGKAAKLAQAAPKTVSRWRKAANVAGTALTPVKQMDTYINPASRFVGAATAKMLENAPGYLQKAAQFGSLSNQNRRFWTGADMLLGQPEENYEYGGIHINPANKGKFTASANRAGMGVQEFAAHVLANKEDYSTTQVRRANFARNAANWKKQSGGPVEGDILDVTPEQLEYLRQMGYQFEMI